MSRVVFDLVAEPRGELLRGLLESLARDAAAVLMVERDELALAAQGRELLGRLQPHLLERTRGSSWPGTTLIDHEAAIYRFRLDTRVLGVVLAATDRLFGWRQPDLPEDIALLREDGSAILASIAHEADAWIEPSAEEHARLVGDVPGISEMIRRSLTCDECGSRFLRSATEMTNLCAECAAVIYGYPPCEHSFTTGSCRKCGWDGSRSDYIRSLLRGD